MPHPKVKLSDDSGNAVSVTGNRLDVNAYLAATPTIDIGDVSIKSGDGTAITDTVSGRLDVTLDSNSGINTHSNGVIAGGIQIFGEAKVIDGSGLPSAVSEGDAGRISMSRAGIQYTHLTNDTGTHSAILEEDSSHSTGDYGVMTLAVRSDTLTAKAGTDGDYTPLQVDASGSLYTNINDSLLPPGTAYAGHRGMVSIGLRNDVLSTVSLVDDGEHTVFQMNAKGALYITGGEVENAAVQSQPTLIGGRYDSSARTLGNGDAGAVALSASGHVLVDLGSTDNTVLDNIQTAVELVDNAVHVDDAGFTLGSHSGMMMMGFAGTNSVNSNDAAALQCSTAGILKTTVSSGTITISTIGSGDNNIGNVDIVSTVYPTHGAINHGQNDTVSSSTAEILTSSTACKHVDVMAAIANTGIIYVGGSGVTAATGIALYPGDTYSIDIDNLVDIYVLSSVNGENVQYVYYV
jgi:hypothetical protein